MNDLAKFDQNMASEVNTEKDESLFFPDPFAPPFRLSGFYWYEQDKTLHRLPAHMAQKVSPGVAHLATQTAGGNICFRTDSRQLFIEACVREAGLSQKFGTCGAHGFDVYMCREDVPFPVYVKTVLPDPGVKQMRLDIPDIDVFDLQGSSPIIQILINFPPYDGVDALQIGLSPNATVLPPLPYSLEKPVVFYGSSITQGACACRPGNSYINHLGRRLNIPCINLGFSGSARGEQEIADIIAGMDMSAFVLDYDHNAPTLAHLEQTHEPFFKTIRQAHPQLPIIMLTRPTSVPTSVLKRRQTVWNTYKKALDAGDEHVYYIDGQTLFGTTDRDACTVDSVHPNDLGFLRMADTIEPVLRKALGME